MYMDLKKALQPRIDIAAREKKDRWEHMAAMKPDFVLCIIYV